MIVTTTTTLGEERKPPVVGQLFSQRLAGIEAKKHLRLLPDVVDQLLSLISSNNSNNITLIADISLIIVSARQREGYAIYPQQHHHHQHNQHRIRSSFIANHFTRLVYIKLHRAIC